MGKSVYDRVDEKFYYDVKREKIIKNPLAEFKFKGHPELEGFKITKTHGVPRRFRPTPETLRESCLYLLDKIALPEAFQWTTLDVIKWIDKLGFPQYRNTFFENRIDGKHLILIDASALAAMKIKDFDHIKMITKSIRDIFQIEQILFGRSISWTPRCPDTEFKFFKVFSGPKYDFARRSDIFRYLRIISDPDPPYDHWRQLENYLKHQGPKQVERIGYAPRRNLYSTKKAQCDKNVSPKRKVLCNCMPPCECEWSDQNNRRPWKLSCLKNIPSIQEGDILVAVDVSEKSKDGSVCDRIAVKCFCKEPCDRHWTAKEVKFPQVLKILRITFEKKYNYKGSTIIAEVM